MRLIFKIKLLKKTNEVTSRVTPQTLANAECNANNMNSIFDGHIDEKSDFTHK